MRFDFKNSVVSSSRLPADATQGPNKKQPVKCLFIIADLENLRMFHTRETPPDGCEHLEEIEIDDPPTKSEPIHDQVSDQAGRFPKGVPGGTQGGMGYGEAHGRILEEERRQIRALAEKIEKLVTAEACEVWRLAAPSKINGRLVGLLSEPVRERLTLNLHADLTKLPIRDIETRLLPAAR